MVSILFFSLVVAFSPLDRAKSPGLPARFSDGAAAGRGPRPVDMVAHAGNDEDLANIRGSGRYESVMKAARQIGQRQTEKPKEGEGDQKE